MVAGTNEKNYNIGGKMNIRKTKKKNPEISMNAESAISIKIRCSGRYFRTEKIC